MIGENGVTSIMNGYFVQEHNIRVISKCVTWCTEASTCIFVVSFYKITTTIFENATELAETVK